MRTGVWTRTSAEYWLDVTFDNRLDISCIRSFYYTEILEQTSIVSNSACILSQVHLKHCTKHRGTARVPSTVHKYTPATSAPGPRQNGLCNRHTTHNVCMNETPPDTSGALARSSVG